MKCHLCIVKDFCDDIFTSKDSCPRFKLTIDFLMETEEEFNNRVINKVLKRGLFHFSKK